MNPSFVSENEIIAMTIIWDEGSIIKMGTGWGVDG